MGRPRKNPLPEQADSQSATLDTTELKEAPAITAPTVENRELPTATLVEHPTPLPSQEEKTGVVQFASDVARFERDSKGLVKGIEYIFNETGLVDWRKMIKKEFLVPNLAKFPEGQNPKELNIEELEDNQLLILLGGIKDLAQTRGIKEVIYKVHAVSQHYVAVSCGITWIGNYETGGRDVYFEALADAHMQNTKSFAQDFLMAIAENRAFTRAVRNFLRINIVGSDEVGDKKNAAPSEEVVSKSVSILDPLKTLQKWMDTASFNFDTVKSVMVKEGVEGAENWTSITDIPKDQVFKLIERIKKKAEK